MAAWILLEFSGYKFEGKSCREEWYKLSFCSYGTKNRFSIFEDSRLVSGFQKLSCRFSQRV